MGDLPHRVAWELRFGPIPAGLIVCHACDNPICLNPDHLLLGTARANAQDMLRKGRHHNNAKTHCPRGHAYDAENTYTDPRIGARHCRACKRQRSTERAQQVRRKEGAQ